MTLFLFLLQVFVISLSGVLAPGPVTAATIAAGAKSRHAGLLISAGHSLVELPLLAAIMFGMGFVFEHHLCKIIIGLAGGLFLLWMGWGMFKELKNFHEDLPKTNSRGTVMTGLLLSITNPYFLLWWATVGLNLAKDAANLGKIAFLLFAVIHSLCDLFWLEAISFASFKGTRLLNSKNQQFILLVCASAIVFFGLVFITKSLLTL